MKTYAQYKDSGISWIGDVPEHWDVVPFRSEFSLGKGLPITKDNLINDEINGAPVVSYGQIHSKENEGTVLKRNLLNPHGLIQIRNLYCGKMILYLPILQKI